MWVHDFVQVRTNNGRPVRLLTIIDEYTRVSGYSGPAEHPVFGCD